MAKKKEAQPKDFKQVIKDLLVRDTLAFKERLDGTPDKYKGMSEKAKKAHEAIVQGNFGKMADPMRQMVTILLGEELPPVKSEGWIFDGCGFIAIKIARKEAGFSVGSLMARLPGFRFDDQNVYKTGFIAQNGGGTSQTTKFDRADFEWASAEDISKFVDGLNDGAINTMKSSVVLL